MRAWQEDTNGNYIVAVENSYDDLGRAKGSTYVVGDRELSYTINYKTNSNLVSSLSMPRAANGGGLMSAILYSYDEFERLTTKEISLSTMASYYSDYAYYGYEVTTEEGIENRTTSLISSVTLRVSYGGNTTSTVYSYTYDNLGNITQIKKDGVIINEYTYDSLGQLVCEEDAVAGVTYIYYYDRAGNLTQKDSYPYAQGAIMGDYISYLASQKQTVATYTYGNSTWGDLLGVYNGKIILYDAIGNPTNWHNATGLTWEARQLQSISLSGGSSASYSYNSNGIRTQKVYNNATNQSTAVHFYTLDGTNIIRERVVATAGSVPTYDLYYIYDNSGVSGFIYNNQYYYYQKNLQGDVVRILNSSGSVVVEYSYDAWGKVLTITGSLASTVGSYNPFRYRSYYYDAETGFYYLQSRYYDPTVARFLNADHPELIGANGGVQGYNLIAYCNNNPILLSDKEGTCVHGDGYYWFQFAAHDLKIGDQCRVCKKTVDHTFFANPYKWTKLAQANPNLSGEEISSLVYCSDAQEKAAAAARAGKTRREQTEIYEREMSTALCFVAGTIIKTENGDEVIEDIQVGDYVWAQDTETGEVALKCVARIFRNETTELVTIKAGNEVIETTPEHPFYVPNCADPRGNSTGLGKGWVKAKDLRQGDMLVLLDGSRVSIDTVSVTTLDEPITVYNFEVEDFHTYFVGNIGLLVHNDCGDHKAICDLAKEYQRKGVSESEAEILWDFAKDVGLENLRSSHGPQEDQYKYGRHIKINGIHINIK